MMNDENCAKQWVSGPDKLDEWLSRVSRREPRKRPAPSLVVCVSGPRGGTRSRT